MTTSGDTGPFTDVLSRPWGTAHADTRSGTGGRPSKPARGDDGSVTVAEYGPATLVTVEPGGEYKASQDDGMDLDLVTIVVDDYDPAITFFVDALGFELAEDSPSLTNDGRPKRWVVVRPHGAATGLLLARADGEKQATVVGEQVAGRVGFFLRVDDFEAAYTRMVDTGVRFATEPRTKSHGRVAVFFDIAGNRWDLPG